MKPIKEHFEQEAQEFDDIILRLIPYYAQMLEALVAGIPFSAQQSFTVIDLGCGTGTISRQIKDTFPLASITCMDLAENMIRMARIKLTDYPDTEFQVGDFNRYSFRRTYDVVVSSLALHHLESDAEKTAFYQKIFNALNPGGVFINADVVLGSEPALQQKYLEKWKAFMRKQVAEDEINHKWMVSYEQEDRPAVLLNQLDWLREIGFTSVDVVWKYYNFAVYGGQKPR